MPRPARVVLALLVAEVAVFTASTFPGVRADEGFHPLIDGWLQGGGYVTAAVLASLRPFSGRSQPAVWAWMAGGVAARAVGFVLFLGVVRWQRPPPFPSMADAAWLAMYGLLLVGVVGLTRQRARRLSTNLVLDGAVGALALAAVVVAVLYEALLALAGTGYPGRRRRGQPRVPGARPEPARGHPRPGDARRPPRSAGGVGPRGGPHRRRGQ
jgi:hypothetical protein